MAPMTAILLAEIMTFFSEWPDLALFFDNAYSTIYRTEALRDVVKRGYALPNEVHEQGLLFQQCGYKAHAQEMALVELEAIYGGAPDLTDAAVESLHKTFAERPWWSRLFGR